MLNIILGEMNSYEGKEVQLGTHSWFDIHHKKEWFRDPFVIKVVNETDKCEYLGDFLFKTKRGDLIRDVDLSGGTKSLISIYEAPEIIFYAQMGWNCSKFLAEIARKHDVTVMLDFYLCFADDDEDVLQIDHKKVTILEYECAIATYCEQERVRMIEEWEEAVNEEGRFKND